MNAMYSDLYVSAFDSNPQGKYGTILIKAIKSVVKEIL